MNATCHTLILVGVSALVQDTAQGAIVHHDPTDIIAVPDEPGLVGVALVDIDRDGAPDFEVSAARSAPGVPMGWDDTSLTNARPGPRFAGYENEVELLAPGAGVGVPGQEFSDGYGAFRVWFGIAGAGQWSYGQGPRFAGFSIDRAGHTHYGWMSVSIDTVGNPWLPRVIVHEWAWESTPGLPIAAGAVPAPAAFGVGAVALFPTCRRRKP